LIRATTASHPIRGMPTDEASPRPDLP
jgi:hypothetical protein